MTQAQDELSALARRILSDRVTADRLAELEAAGLGFDAALWADLAGAGILAAALPEAAGGDGYGLTEQCSILVECGNMKNPADSALLESPDGRQKYADALVRGVAGFLAAQGQAR